MGAYRFLAAALTLAIPAVAAADPVRTADLASPTAWAVCPQAAVGWTPHAVPAQIAVGRSAAEWVDYRRTVDVPAVVAGQQTVLHLESVNDGGEVFVDGRSAGTVDYALFPADVDLTPLVTPGRSAELTIRCFDRAGHYQPPGAFPSGLNDLHLLGVPRGVSLLLHGPVYIADQTTRADVAADTLAVDVWLTNGTDRPRRTTVHAALGPGKWAYPAIADQAVTLPPHATTRVTLTTRWGLGRDSYWWPNIPFDPAYRAVRHRLTVTAADDTITQPFGFVQVGERAPLYTVNGVGVFQSMDSAQEHLWSEPGEPDGFGVAFAKLPGWVDARPTWVDYQRLGINTFRLHTSAATDAMLEAADDCGMMLVGESAIRGYAHPEGIWDARYKPAVVPAMVRAYRRHPSGVRYSLDNEWRAATTDPKIAAGLIAAAAVVDASRPLSFSQDAPPWDGKLTGTLGHAWVMQHYHQPTAAPGRIVGVEEAHWDRAGTTRNELIGCARDALLDRLDGYAAFGPWTVNNYWCDFVRGGSYATGTVNRRWRNKDRTPGVDGWGSDVIRFVQNGYAPYAAADVDMIRHHLNTEAEIFSPDTVPAFTNQPTVTRQLVVFNNGLAPHRMAVDWSLHLDAPGGPAVDHGRTAAVRLDPGTHATPTVTLHLPKTDGRDRRAYLVLRTVLDGGAIVFTEDRYFFRVSNR